jgi:hypothetical protein
MVQRAHAPYRLVALEYAPREIKGNFISASSDRRVVPFG